MRLVGKTRNGAKVRHHYDRGPDPCQRAQEPPTVTVDPKQTLRARYLDLNPVELRRGITRCQEQLLELSRRKPVPSTSNARR
jgi:hypothetical protein